MIVESEKRIMEIIEELHNLCPIKIFFNGILLYDDYDCQYEIADGIYGELESPKEVLPKRLWNIDDYIVTSVKIEIVQFHHSIVELFGVYSPKRMKCLHK